MRTYMANPDLNTYGSGKYTGLMLEHAGAYNVAAATVKGFKQVSMENVLEWNPAVILVQDRYPKVVSQIKEDAAWANIDAVKNKSKYFNARICKSLGLSDAGSLSIRRSLVSKIAISTKIPRYRFR